MDEDLGYVKAQFRRCKNPNCDAKTSRSNKTGYCRGCRPSFIYSIKEGLK